MKKLFITLLTFGATTVLFAQNKMEKVLNTIEQNNTTLKALRETRDAQQLENKTGIYLSDPEIGFNYLWGNPSSVGTRQDISVKQNFDLPTISGLKSKVATGQNELLEWQYKADRMNILLEAKQYYFDLIYYNALLEELSIRKQHAQILVDGQKERLNRGDGTILAFNNVKLNLSTVQGEVTRIETERNAILSQLTRLNGGEALPFDEAEFAPQPMPANFQDWLIAAEEKSPVLAYVKEEMELSRKQLSLSKSMGLPTFSVGYMSENGMGQRYQGVTMGVSVPLWSNKNRVKQAKTAVKAAESRQVDVKQQFFSQLEILYKRALGLKNVAETYRASLEDANNSNLLKKALDAGEISILDYMVEIGLYYNTVNQALQAELDYQKAFAELSANEL